jgi:glycosyltransferase involved in cell wall biosynthesis
MKVSIYHNILWSKYKGVVFSQVHSRSPLRGIAASFIQIAETEDMRVALGGVDLSYHQYPFRLLFRGAYQNSSILERIIALYKDMLRNPCDLVVIPGYHRTEHWAMLFLCMILHRKRAVFCDSTSFDKPRVFWKEFAKRRFFRRCHGVFCYGVRSKEYLMSYGVSESRINFRCQVAALPHSYDSARVMQHYREKRPSFDPHEPRFLYVGRLSREKGLDDLLRAVQKLQATLPRAKLDIVGAGPSGVQLKTLCGELGLDGSVSFLGAKSLDDIAGLFTECTALVLPSHSEPWGLVVNEALSYGCPVVVSNACGCVPDLVLNDGITGFSHDAGDINGMADALALCARSTADRVAVAASCLELISKYTPERAATQILDGCIRIAAQNP